MKIEKVKVWWQKLDADGNVIEHGEDDREYVNWGSARNRGEKLFGKGRYWSPSVYNETPVGVEPKIRWRISHRDPWAEYFGEYECDICGAIHKRKETNYGYDQGDRFHMYLMDKELNNKYRDLHRICPTCADKLTKYINKLQKGRKK